MMKNIISKLNYDNLFQSLGTAYVVFDTNDPIFTVLEENQAHADVTMVDRNNVIGRPVLEAFPNMSDEYIISGKSRLLGSIQKVIATGKPDTMPNLSYDIKDKNGVLTKKFWQVTHYPVIENNNVRAICQQIKDITDIMSTRQELKDTQGQPEQAISKAARANKSALIASKANLFQHGKIEIDERTKLQKELEKFNLVLEDGVKKRTIELEKTNVGLQAEIARRHKLERQRVQHYIDLNKTKDEFISLSSHQLRTPATGVKQYLGMVLEGMAGDISSVQRTFLNKAYESNERQLTIVSDLLKVAQVDSGKVKLRQEMVDISLLLKDVIKEQQNTYATRKQKMRFIKPLFKAIVFVDSDKIRMVLENMIDNASKYSDPGKIVQVTITEDDDMVIVAVKDQGVGIAQKDLEKLFEKFSRIHNHLSNHVGGTGLGLYWAKKVVDLHGGIIKVTSVIDEGTTFSICLPRNGDSNEK